jgi:hypothetical protein
MARGLLNACGGLLIAAALAACQTADLPAQRQDVEAVSQPPPPEGPATPNPTCSPADPIC